MDDQSVLVSGRHPIIATRAVRRRIAQIWSIFSDSQAILLETELRDLIIDVETVEWEYARQDVSPYKGTDNFTLEGSHGIFYFHLWT
jgi:hypothetical protein